ncbi:hypothetical protein K435DRAFT_869270 [Dendrothele bispora CBS 962.96]|uniref:Uncharacterized protein n=1 Tax=Dendrothele bispora (strain CBS 962.96) TaxID=1314807 RepID=A0A4S8L9Y3_DENBC|nr:hypothetical protein K435DRAFT_869270 [Dendrothele bispora CBS 962.96]
MSQYWLNWDVQDTVHGTSQTKHARHHSPEPSPDPAASDPELNLDSPLSHHSRNSDQSVCSQSESSDTSSEFLCEDEDVPTFQNENSLISWLTDGQNCLQARLHRQQETDQKDTRKWKTKPIGSQPAVQTQYTHNAIIQKNKATHESSDSGEQIELSEAQVNEGESSTPQQTVTIEEVDDEDFFHEYRTLDASVSWLLEEDGVDDIPESVFYNIQTSNEEPIHQEPPSAVSEPPPTHESSK